MGYQAKKTEHSGAKHGNGAYWGPKQDAKKQSSKIRRRNWKKDLRQQSGVPDPVTDESPQC